MQCSGKLKIDAVYRNELMDDIIGMVGGIKQVMELLKWSYLMELLIFKKEVMINLDNHFFYEVILVLLPPSGFDGGIYFGRLPL